MASEIKCSICGSETIVRTAKKGPKAGHSFHVCIRYPDCKGKVPIKKQIDAERPFKGKEVKTTGKRKVVIGILLIPIAFPLMGAIPGAIIGLITGLFGFHLIAAIIIGIFIFITYPRSRRRWGSEPDLLTYFLALCGAAGGGFACYFVGNLLQ